MPTMSLQDPARGMPEPQGPGLASSWWDHYPVIAQLAGLATLLVSCALLIVLTRLFVLPAVRRAIRRSRFVWDDAFVDHRFFRWLSLVPPLLLARYGVALLPQLEYVPAVNATLMQAWQCTASALLALVVMFAGGALLNGINAIYSGREIARSRPIKGYVQIAKIVLYVVGSITAVAVLFDKDPRGVLAGLGAMTAVVMLIFKDTLLSLVASIQLSSNDMVRVGDWIEMPKYGADGDVIDIALHTIKIQNWDKTITTVPTYALISDSYKNWRGMQEAGGRRVKRSLYIDLSTVSFLDDAGLERLSRLSLLADYLRAKREELAAHNAERGTEATADPNRRRLTNVGTLRAYIEAYLRANQAIHPYMTFMVRQLQPTEHGLGIEIYIFTKTTNWVEYERIQADIFDHILAILPEFGLRAYQRPAGADLAALQAASG